MGALGVAGGPAGWQAELFPQLQDRVCPSPRSISAPERVPSIPLAGGWSRSQLHSKQVAVPQHWVLSLQGEL